MSKISWKNNLDGMWSNAANWSGGVLPGAADDVTLATRTYHTITYSSAAGSTTIHSITASNDGLNITGGALTVLAGASLENVSQSGGGALILDGPTASVSGTFTDTQGYTALGTATTLTLGGQNNFGTNNAYQDGATLDYGTLSTTGTTSIAAAPNPYGNYYGYWQLTLGGGADWVNSGTVDDGGYILTGDGAGATASITNAAGAQFDFTTDDGSIDNGSFYNQYGQQIGGSSTFSNAGTFAKTGGTSTSYVDSAFTNTGLIDVATGSIEFDGGGSFGGTITGPGQVAFGGGNATLTSADFTAGGLLVDGGDLTLSGPLTYAGSVNIVNNGATLSLDGSADAFTSGFSQSNTSTIALNGSTLTSASVYLGNESALVGPGTLSIGGTSSIGDGDNDYFYSYYISEGAELLNTGTLNDYNAIRFNGSDGTGGSIVNSATGTFDITNTAAIYTNNNSGPISITNAGTFELSGNTNIVEIDPYFTNTGVIYVATGTLEFDGGGVFGGTLTGSGGVNFGGGTSTLTASAVLSLSGFGIDGGALQLTVPLDYAGGIYLSFGALLLDGGADVVSGAFDQSGGTVDFNGGSLDATGGFSSTAGTLDLAGGSLDVENGYFATYGTLTGSGVVSLTGTTAFGDGLGYQYYIDGGVAITNSGTMDLNQYIYFYDQYGAGNSLTNTAGSTIDITGDWSIEDTYYAADIITNAGTFAKTGGTNTSQVEVAFVNTGTISVACGTLDFSGGGTFAGTITGAGTIEFDSGTSTLTAASLFSAGGLYLDGATLVLEAPENFQSTQFTETNGTLDLNGFNASVKNANLTYYGTLSGTGILSLYGTTTIGNGQGYTYNIENSAIIYNDGTLDIDQYINFNPGNNPGYLGGTLTNALGGTINLQNTYNLSDYYSQSTIDNAGLFELTSGTGSAIIGAYFTSTKTISAASGTMEFQGGGSFSGNLTGAAEIQLWSATYTLGVLTSNVATLDLYNSALVLTAGVSDSGAFYAEGSTIYGSNATLTSSGGFNVDQAGDGDTIEGGTLSTTGSTTVVDWYVSGLMFVVGGGGTWSNSGTAGISGLMQLGDNNGSGTIVNKATGVIDLATDDATINQGSYDNSYGALQSSGSTIVNSGTFAKTGGSSISNVYATLTSTGTIGSTSGTLSLDDGGALSGTIQAKSNVILAGGTFTDGTLGMGNSSHVTNNSLVSQTGVLTIGDATKGASFINDGTYALTAGGTIASGTGAGSSFANVGLLEQLTGTTRSVVSVNVANTGTIYAGSGALALTGTLSGAGALQIGAGATLELGANASSVAETASFETNTGTLALDAVGSVKEKISGFVVGDTIDLVNTAATSASLNSSGQLVVDNGSAAIGTLALTGTHTGDVYAVGSDGHGGSKITITSNSTTWKATTNDWYTANQWNNGAPGIGSKATVSGSNAFTLSLASGESAAVNTLALTAAKATTALAGTLDVGTSVTQSAGTLAMDNDTLLGGTLVLSAGTVVWAGGELDNTVLDGALNLSAAGAQAGLEGTSYLTGTAGTGNGTVTLTGAGANLYTQGDFTLDSTTVTIGNSTSAAVLSSYDVDGQGDILQLGPNLKLVQNGLYAVLQDGGNADDAVFNAGVIAAAINGGTFSIYGNDFENDGTINVSKGDDFAIQSAQFVNTGALTVTAGTLSLGTGYFENDGSITTTNSLIIASSLLTTAELLSLLGGGDQLSISGTLNNTGATLSVGPGTAAPTVTLTGTIEGGTIVDATGALALDGGTLSAVTFEGSLNLTATNALVYFENGSSVTGAGGTGTGTVSITGGNADLDFTNSGSFNSATVRIGNASTAYIELGSNQGGNATLTLGAGVTIDHTGQSAQIYYDQDSDTIISDGTINATLAGGSFYIGQSGSGTFVNGGTINVANGDALTVDVGTFSSIGLMTLDSQSTINFDSYLTTASLDTLQNVGGTVNIVDYLDNSSGTLTVGAGTSLGTLSLYGTIANGTVVDNGGGIAFDNGTLSNVTYQGLLNLSATNETVYFLNGSSLVGARGSGAGTAAVTGANSDLYFVNTSTFDSATVSIGNATTAYLELGSNQGGNAVLTLGSGLTVNQTGALAQIYFDQSNDTVVSNGAINAIASAGNFSISESQGYGTFDNNGSLRVAGGSVLAINANLANLIGTTLTGGSYEADANSLLQLSNNTSITTLQATITLNGTGSTIESLNTSTNSETTLDSKLSNIGTAGVLNLSGGRGLSGPNLTDSGALYIAGAKLSENVLAIGSTGTLRGFGTVVGTLTDNGVAEAHNGTLTLQKATTGTGALKIDSGATLEIGVSTAAAENVAFTSGGGVLQIDAASGFLSTVSGLAGNSIVLPNSTIASDSVSGTLLTLKLGGGTSLTYTLASTIAANKLVISSDGHTLTAYGNAVASGHSPEPVALGPTRVGTSLSQALSIGNAASASGSFEALDANIGSASAGITASGSFTGLAAGATDSADLTVGIGATTAGSITGIAVISLYSDGTGLDTAGKSSLGTQVVNVTGSVYAPAVAQLGTTTLNFGVVHVGDAAALATQTLTIGNTASGALTDFLTGGFGAITGSSAFASDGNSLDVAAGSSGALGISLATTNSGSFTGTAALALFSHDAVLADLALTAGPIALSGVVDNYALAALQETSGGGSVTSQTATSTAIDLGQIALGASAVSIGLEALNAATGTADLLGGTLTVSGSSAFSNSGLGSFSGLGAGGTDTAPLAMLTTSNAGTFTETITLTANGSNVSGYIGATQTDTFSITGTVVGPETITLLSTAGTYIGGPANDTFIAANATLVAGDVINGEGGTDTLSLTGGGIFNLALPASISSIEILQAQEGQAASGSIRSTYQTVTLAAGVNLAVDVGPGTPNGSNPNPSGILINGAANSDVITLGNGTDTVAGASVTETITAGSGTDLISAAIANAGVLVTGHSVTSTTLSLTAGGTATLNAGDTELTVKLNAATNLALGPLGFITVSGSSGNDTLTAGGSGQTLIGNGGNNLLTGSTAGGDIFADTSAHFSTDTVVNWTSGDMLDLTDMSPSGSLSYSGNATSGKLTVSDGTHVATIAFRGDFTSGNFTTLTTDGHGGSLIAYQT